MPEDIETPPPEYPFPWMPLLVGAIELVGWDGHSYVDRQARTYWSGLAEPSEVDAQDAVSTPRTPPAPAQTDAEIYAAQQALGYLDTTTGIRLKCTEYAQAKFTSQVALTRLALSLGAITGATEQTLWDADNTEHTLSTDAFLLLMLRYGMHCKAIFDQYAP